MAKNKKAGDAQALSLPVVATGAIVQFKSFIFDPNDETGQTVEANLRVTFNSEVAPGAEDLPVYFAINAPEATILSTVRNAVKGLVLEQQAQPLTNSQILVEAVPK